MTALVVVLLGICGWVIGKQLSSSSAPRHRSHTAGSVKAGFTAFTDPAHLFSGSYPSSWKRVQTSTPGDVLLANGPDGASYLVQETALNAAVGTANLGAALTFTKRIVDSGNHVRLLHKTQLLSFDGLPTFLWLYTFTDPTTGNVGAHAQYFVFDHKTMITLVFQSLPSTYFRSDAATFDSIARTFSITAP